MGRMVYRKKGYVKHKITTGEMGNERRTQYEDPKWLWDSDPDHIMPTFSETILGKKVEKVKGIITEKSKKAKEKIKKKVSSWKLLGKFFGLGKGEPGDQI